MRVHTNARLGLLLGVVLLAGCERRDRTTIADRAGDTLGAADTRVDTARLGARPAADYSYEQRDAFRRDIEERVREMDRRVDSLRTALKQTTDPARARAVETYTRAKEELERATSRLGAATATTWERMRENVSDAFDRLDVAYTEAVKGSGAMGGQGPMGKDTMPGDSARP